MECQCDVQLYESCFLHVFPFSLNLHFFLTWVALALVLGTHRLNTSYFQISKLFFWQLDLKLGLYPFKYSLYGESIVKVLRHILHSDCTASLTSTVNMLLLLVCLIPSFITAPFINDSHTAFLMFSSLVSSVDYFLSYFVIAICHVVYVVMLLCCLCHSKYASCFLLVYL